MVKLDVTLMRFLEDDDYRILTALELCMRNHKVVPTLLLDRVAKLKTSTRKRLLHLSRYRIVNYMGAMRSTGGYEGYCMNYNSYDLLALHTFLKRRTITGVGHRIGCGKESDIFLVEKLPEMHPGDELAGEGSDGEDGGGSELYVLKLQRLGRCSFRSVARNRDYKSGVRGCTEKSVDSSSEDVDGDDEASVGGKSPVKDEEDDSSTSQRSDDSQSSEGEKEIFSSNSDSDESEFCENEFGLVPPSVADQRIRARKTGINTKPRRGESWFYLSRLAATKEYLFMQLLYQEGFPVPKPIDHNRHAIVMEWLGDGVLLNNIEQFEPYERRVRRGSCEAERYNTSQRAFCTEGTEAQHAVRPALEEDDPVASELRRVENSVGNENNGVQPSLRKDGTVGFENDDDYFYVTVNTAQLVYDRCMRLLIRLAEHGLVHGDFNEFNLIIMNGTLEVKMIDFPQCISTDHPNASDLFARDVKNLNTFFLRRFRLDTVYEPRLRTDVTTASLTESQNENQKRRLDVLAFASGCFSAQQQKELEKGMGGGAVTASREAGGGENGRSSTEKNSESLEKSTQEGSALANVDEGASRTRKVKIVQRGKNGVTKVLGVAETSENGVEAVKTKGGAVSESYINESLKKVEGRKDDSEFLRSLHRNVQKGKRGKNRTKQAKSKFVTFD